MHLWLALLLGAGATSTPRRRRTPVDPNKIAVFGSSVAHGYLCSGNCSGHTVTPKADPGGCYQSRLRVYQEKHHSRSVIDVSRNGDDTKKALARFDQLLDSRAGFVFLGLSLHNEGIAKSDDAYPHYDVDMRKIIAKIRAEGAVPVIGDCYPDMKYSDHAYGMIKRMNIHTQTWDLETPQVNFLGAIEDGHGRWVKGFSKNDHPTDVGSTEMYYSFVPSLFDAIKQGKSTIVQRADSSQYLTLASRTSRIVFKPKAEEVIHSFTLSFNMRCTHCSGQIAAVEVAAVSPGSTDMRQGSTLALEIDAGGRLVYASHSASSHVVTDGKWHTALLTHYWCNQTTTFFVDGQMVSQSKQRLAPTQFELSPAGGGEIDYQDLIIYRSGLNADERAFLRDNKTVLLHASLEVFAPLDARRPTQNRAQSLSIVDIVNDGPSPAPPPTFIV